MKTFAGFVAFIVVWTLLGYVGSHYIFKEVAEAFPDKFNWVMWFGGVTMLLAVGVEKIAEEIAN